MIGLVITELLTVDVGLEVLVDDRIFPIVIPADTVLPAVVYAVADIEPQYTKEGWAVDIATFRVQCAASTYADTQTVALAIRKALEFKSGTYASIVIDKVRMTGMDEVYQEGAYIIKLIFTTRINSYG